MESITKQDLKDFENRFVDHLNLKLEPVVEDVNGHKLTLYGTDNRNGLVGDVNGIKTSGKWIRWLAGSGLLAGLSGWVNKLFS